MGISDFPEPSGSSLLKPNFHQLLEQGVIRKSKILKSLGDGNNEMFFATDKIRPIFPQESDWISLEGLSVEGIELLDRLYAAAQQEGVVFTRNNNGTISATDTKSILGYSVNWYWPNVDSFSSEIGLTDTEIEIRNMMKEKPRSGSLKRIEDSKIETIRDINKHSCGIVIIQIGDEIVHQGETPVITDIYFDIDTLFDGKDTHERVIQDSKNRMAGLMNHLK